MNILTCHGNNFNYSINYLYILLLILILNISWKTEFVKVIFFDASLNDMMPNLHSKSLLSQSSFFLFWSPSQMMSWCILLCAHSIYYCSNANLFIKAGLVLLYLKDFLLDVLCLIKKCQNVFVTLLYLPAFLGPIVYTLLGFWGIHAFLLLMINRE